MNSSVCVTIASISSRSASNFSRKFSSSSISARSRMRVSGVLRSWDIAVRRRVRSSMKLDQPGLHGVEGMSGAADLERTAFRQRRAIDVASELVGGRGE